jgi:hypothetical protein
VGSNPTRCTDVCVSLFFVCVVLSVGRGLPRSLLTMYTNTELKKLDKAQHMGWRAINIKLLSSGRSRVSTLQRTVQHDTLNLACCWFLRNSFEHGLYGTYILSVSNEDLSDSFKLFTKLFANFKRQSFWYDTNKNWRIGEWIHLRKAMKIEKTCKIWGLHGGDYEEWRLLGCYAMWLL